MQTTYRSVLGVLLLGALSAVFAIKSFAQAPFYFFFLGSSVGQVLPNQSTSFNFVIFVMPVNGYTGTINFTCTATAVGGPWPLPTCSTPLPVTITSGPVFPHVTIATVTTDSATREGNRYHITLNATDARGVASANGAVMFPLLASVAPVTYIVGGGNGPPAGGGEIAVLTLAVLLGLWSIKRLWRAKRAAVAVN